MIFAKLAGWCFRQTNSVQFQYCIGKHFMTLPRSCEVHTERDFVQLRLGPGGERRASSCVKRRVRFRISCHLYIRTYCTYHIFFLPRYLIISCVLYCTSEGEASIHALSSVNIRNTSPNKHVEYVQYRCTYKFISPLQNQGRA